MSEMPINIYFKKMKGRKVKQILSRGGSGRA
jgi:hypothetical protein